MAIDLDNITSGYNISKINANFQRVEDYINEMLLARADTGVAGEAKMERDLDMDGFRILNADIDGSSLTNDRAIRVPPGEPALAPLPDANTRKGKVLTFDINTGLPVVSAPASGSAVDVLNQLALPTGAGLVGTTGGITVQQKFNNVDSSLSTINTTLNQTGHVGDLAKEGRASVFNFGQHRPHRVFNKTVPQDATNKYDHFGIMDIKPDGTLWQTYRRGFNHTDAGVTVYTELQTNGVWTTPVVVVSSPGIDCRGGAGGTAPDGAMYISGAYATPPSSTPFTGAFVYRSLDYGTTWTQVANIPNPDVGTNAFIIPFGKIATMGNKLVIPAYRRDNLFTSSLTYLQSSDNGATWSVGANINSGTDYNEAAILNMGDGLVLCVARTGNGTVQPDGSRRLRQFISADGGVNWTDQGYVIGPDAADEIAWQLVTPALSLVYSGGGTPYVLLTYTARVGGIRYRTCPVTTLTQGSTNWSVYYNGKTIATEFESGYQSQVVIDNVVYVNYYATTTTDAVSVPTQFQIPLGELPDYESTWLAVSALTNVTANHGLLAIPRKTVILFSADNIGKTAIYPADNGLYYNGTTTQGAGIAWQVNISGYTLRPGTYMMYQGVFGTGGTNPTSGFAKILAWK